MILSKNDREFILGDLGEEFASVAEKHGVDFARRWYWMQVLWATLDRIMHGAERIAGLFKQLR